MDFSVKHPTPQYLRLILGGADLRKYPGFNGLFTRPVIKLGSGAFLERPTHLLSYAKECNPMPEPDC